MWWITSIEKGRAFTWATGSPRLSVTARHLVEATPDGSRATQSIRFLELQPFPQSGRQRRPEGYVATFAVARR